LTARAGAAYLRPVPSPGSTVPVLRLRPESASVAARLRELAQYRDLLLFLAWRDVQLRYRQTALGVAWAVLQPLLSMLVFSVFFGALARVPSDGRPYPLFAYCGLLPWQLFAFALTSSAGSLTANERLVTKVYFPRLILPLASVLAGLVDFAVAFALLLPLLWFYGARPGLELLALPVFVLLALGAAVAAGLGLGALNVRYRDVRHALPFLTQLWLFVTPIVYPASLVPERLRPLLGLNPMAGVVEGFRWALLGQAEPPLALIGVSALMVLVGLVASLLYFLRVERSFADVI
jgi:lipopolysaccharide transport system permease protein